MSISIQHNMLMMNTDRMMRANTLKKTKSAEKLSSGYRINRAADDAAGLAMSEKMRWMVRGLNKGTENAQDGVSWVQIGDGSLEETHAMLHRMTELAIKASNGTNTDADRAMMQAEFNQLQKEVDRLTGNTYFNEKHIFSDHESPFYQYEGATAWPENQVHTVRSGENDLVMTYRLKESDPPKTVSITVPPGEYTTRELIDEIDTAIENAGLLKEGLAFEYTSLGICNLNLEGGEKIDGVSGGLSYLLYDNFGGGDLGALIGTTGFGEGTKLQVRDDTNDKISFKLLDPEDDPELGPGPDSKTTTVTLDLDASKKLTYTKDELMQMLRDELIRAGINTVNADGTVNEVVKVDHYGTNIMMSSEDFIITEFKGNMFEVDTNGFTSIFYDNIHHVDDVIYTNAQFNGAGVLQVTMPSPQNPTAEAYDPEAAVFHFNDTNNILVIRPNETGEPITFDLTNLNGESMDGKDMVYVCDALNRELARVCTADKYPDGPPLEFEADLPIYYEDMEWKDNQGIKKYVGYAAMRITTKDPQPGKYVGVDSTCSAYNTLFRLQQTTDYRVDASFGGNDTKPDSNAKLMGGRDVSGGLKVTNANNAFHIDIGRVGSQTLSADITLDLPTMGAYSISGLVNQIQSKLDEAFKDAPAEMKDADGRVVVVSSVGGHIALTGATDKAASIRTSAVAGNNGYNDIFPDEKVKPEQEEKTRQGSPESQPEIVLPEGARFEGGKVIIPEEEGNLVVYVDGNPRTANLYTGAPGGDGKWDSLKALADFIDSQMGPEMTQIRFTTRDVMGTKDTVTAPGDRSAEGNTNDRSVYDATGTTQWSAQQGQAGTMVSNTPPTLQLGAKIPLSESEPFHAGELKFSIKGEDINPSDFSINLNKDYTKLEDLRKDLESAINARTGKTNAAQCGYVSVKTVGNTLSFTVTVGDKDDPKAWVGAETSIAIDKTSQFIQDMGVGKTSPSITLRATENGTMYSRGIQNFTPPANADLVFRVTTPSGETQVNVTLAANNSYTGTSVAAAVEAALKAKGFDFTASYYDASYGGGLTITAGLKCSGDGYKIKFDAGASQNAMEYMYGYKKDDGTYSFENGKPATTSLNRSVKSEFTIESGKNHFKISVDGTDYDIELEPGDYGTEGKDLAKQIQDKVNQKAGREVLEVSLSDSGTLTFTTKSADGSKSKIYVAYDGSDSSAMPAIFGSTQIAGVDAEFDANGKLHLTRLVSDTAPDPYPNGGSIKVVSDNVNLDEEAEDGDYRHSLGYQGGSFIHSDKKDFDPEFDDGYHSTNYSFMQGVSLAGTNKLNADGTIEINEYNSKLTFYYTDNYYTEYYPANPAKISIDVLSADKKSENLSVSELINRLQTAVDQQTGGERKINVSLKDGGILFQAANPGMRDRIYLDPNGEYQNHQPSGGFYDKVLCGGSTGTTTMGVTELKGDVAGGEVYAVGRQDVKNNEVKIQKDGNDTLSLEFTVPDWPEQPVTLKMRLDPGYYKGDSLVEQIQGKLNQALKDAGLPEGLIEVGIGTVHESVQIAGALNDRALAFKLSSTVKGPAMGGYGIEAIGGTAAFSIFYATEGDIARAYIKGGKDITNGVEIKPGAANFAVDVDGVTYQIDLDPGFYSAEDLAAHINEKLQSDNNGNKVPLKAIIDDGHLKLMHNKYGKHNISNLRGGVKEQLFFTERGEKNDDDSIHLRLSSVSGDWTEIDRPWMNTVSLGINSLTIGKYKNAQKAIERLKAAVTKVGDVRSYFGATQNRLESTIRNNENKAENTAAAESRIRDADFSKEMMENSLHNILEQVGASMMAQTKQNAQLALQMLS